MRKYVGRGPQKGIFCPHGVWGLASGSWKPSSSPAWKPPIPILLGFLWRLSQVGIIHFPLYFQLPSPLWRMGGGGGVRIASIQLWLVFLVCGSHPGGIQNPTWSHLKRTIDPPGALIAQELNKYFKSMYLCFIFIISFDIFMVWNGFFKNLGEIWNISLTGKFVRFHLQVSPMTDYRVGTNYILVGVTFQSLFRVTC